MWVAVSIIAAALVSGLYLSGYLTLRLLGLPPAVHWHSYLAYVRALDLPALKPYVGRIEFAGCLGFGRSLFQGGNEKLGGSHSVAFPRSHLEKAAI